MEEQLQSIGKAIQEGRFDPNRLNNEDKKALDGLLKQGLVPGYNSLADVTRERDTATMVKAGEYVEAAKPLETATGVSKGTFEGIAAATVALGNYWLRGKDLTKADLTEAYRSKSKAGMSRYFKALGSMFDDIDLKKIPKSRADAVKLVFKNLKEIIPNTKQYFKTSQKLYNMGDPTIIRSKVEADTIAKTALASGFAAGAYEIGNSAMDFATNNELDVAKVTNNELLKLSTPEKIMYSSYEAIKNSLLFDAGALGLFGIIGNGLSFTGKFLTGTRSAASKEAVLKSRQLGAPIGLSIAADPNATMGPLIKGFGEFVGALPLQSVNLKAQKQKFNTAVTRAYMTPFMDQSAFGYLGPIQHTETFGYQALPIMKDLYKESENQIDDLWEGLEGYYRGIDNEGNLDIIGMPQTQKMVQAVRGRFEQDYPEFMREMAKSDPNVANLMNQYSPFYSLVKLLNDMSRETKRYTMGQYINLRKSVNAALKAASPNDKFIPAAEQLRFAMELDLNNIYGKGSDNSVLNMFKESETVQTNLKRIADGETVKVGGKTFKADTTNEQTVEVMQNAYLEELRNGIKGMSEKLKTSNYMTTRLLSPYDRLSIRNQLKKYDTFVFSQKQLANVVGGASATPDTLFKNLFRNTFVKGSSGSVNELKKLLGVDRVVEKGALNPGKEVYRRAKARHLMDAYLRAFENPPNLDYKNVIDFVEEAIEKKYVPENYTDEMLRAAKNGEPIGYNFFTTKTAQGLGEIDLRNTNVSPEELGDFSYDKFLKNLGLDKGDEGYTRLVNVMSEGTSKSAIEKGKKELDTLLDLMFISKEGDAIKIGDPAKLLQRSVALGGAGRISSLAYGKPAEIATIAGLGFFAGLGPMILPPLIFRTLGLLLMKPEYAAKLLDAYTTEERLAKAGKFKLLPDKIRAKRKLIAQILNAVDEENQDKAQIDVDKISDEEITDTIQRMKTYYPDTTVNVDMLPENTQQKLFPEFVIYKNAKGREKEFYDQFITGLNEGTTEIARDDTDGEIPTMDILNFVKPQEVEEQPEQPMQPQQPAFAINQTPTMDTMLSGLEFGNLFPDDPMGQMIAQRREKRRQSSG